MSIVFKTSRPPSNERILVVEGALQKTFKNSTAPPQHLPHPGKDVLPLQMPLGELLTEQKTLNLLNLQKCPLPPKKNTQVRQRFKIIYQGPFHPAYKAIFFVLPVEGSPTWKDLELKAIDSWCCLMVQKSGEHQLIWAKIPLFTGFYTSQVVQDFFHQRYQLLL